MHLLLLCFLFFCEQGQKPKPTPPPAAVTTASTTTFDVTRRKIARAFPGALSNRELRNRVTTRLERYNFPVDKTLVASSLCSDEVNRPLEDVFLQYYGNHFAMGGLAGFPFSGLTGFGAMASHIPDGGSCLLVYGPHVGVDLEGNVGKVNRRGVAKSSTCCGSAVAASKYIDAVMKGDNVVQGPPQDSLDAQQSYVTSLLLPYGSRFVNAPEPMVELPYTTFEPIDGLMTRIVGKAAGKVPGQVALLGGIQINTPPGCSDYFLPLRFDVRDKDNKVVADLMAQI